MIRICSIYLFFFKIIGAATAAPVAPLPTPLIRLKFTTVLRRWCQRLPHILSPSFSLCAHGHIRYIKSRPKFLICFNKSFKSVFIMFLVSDQNQLFFVSVSINLWTSSKSGSDILQFPANSIDWRPGTEELICGLSW